MQASHADAEPEQEQRGPPQDTQVNDVESVDHDGARKKRKRVSPCDNCREKHIKCDLISTVCSRCQRNGERCIRSRSGIKFRHGSSARYDTKLFATDQTWLKPKRTLELKYIDETAELLAIYDRDADFTDADELDAEDDAGIGQGLEPSFGGAEAAVGSTFGLAYDALSSPELIGRATHLSNGGARQNFLTAAVSVWSAQTGTQFAVDDPVGSAIQTSPIPVHHSPVQTRQHDLDPPASSSPLYTGLVKKPSRSSTYSIHNILEVILLRYFVDVLARWFDLCDPEKHFEFIVPQRARWCPPLRNAILAASARHLTSVRKPGPGNVYHHDGYAVPELTSETALQYHSECIKDLLKRSLDPEQVRDENLLAAAIILRFYEEIDAPFRGDDERDSELFLRVMNVFIDAQIPSVPLVPHSSPIITGPKVGATYDSLPSPEVVHSPAVVAMTPPSQSLAGSSGGQSRWRANGLCHASFWVAFRQEIYSAFSKQRPFNHDLSRCEAFRSFSPAEDAVWADRLIIFSADVLEFCYGNSNPSNSRQDPTLSAKDNWLALKQQEKMWPDVLPASFEPVYYRDPDRSKGEVFPEICYLADCHVTGVQHVDLAKILLTVYDPTRPKLGPGHVASLKALGQELRTIVLRLCGIALSNRKTPPGLVTALLGIVVCGDQFVDSLEQDALLGLLDELEGTHAWPVGNTRSLLKEAWERT